MSRVGADPDSTTPAGVPVPAFVARSRVAEYQLMAEQSREAVHVAQIEAEAQIAAIRQDAAAQVNEFRSTYPTRFAVPLRAGRQGRALAVPGARHVARRSAMETM